MRLYFLILLVSISLAACGDKKPNSQNAVNTNANKTNAAPNATAAASTPNASANAGGVPVYTYEIVNTYNHDPEAFTEGLFFRDGFLYESTGEAGRSGLRKVKFETGKVVQQKALGADSFGEGATFLNGIIYQLTWQEETAYSFDADTFKPLKEFRYQGEGWGLTTDGANLIMSDGTHMLKFINPETFKTVRSVPVIQENGKPLYWINELEFIKGEIWANVWHSDQNQTSLTMQGTLPNLGKPNTIARIDPQTGKVVGWIDLVNISPDDVKRDPENVLNGIAYDAAGDRIFVTGKQWKNLFEIKVKPKA
jgi:glutamine cyclotransferase